MKTKIITFSIIYIICLFLSGCTTRKFDSSSNSFSSKIISEDSSYNWQMVTDTDGYAQCNTGDGYFECKGGKLFYTDYTTLKKIILCNRPECTHSDSSCSGFLGRYAVPFFVGNKFYLFYPNLFTEKENELAQIVEMDLISGEKRTIITFDPSEDIIYGLLTDGKKLYFNLLQVIKDETETVDASYTIHSLDLESGKLTALKKNSNVEYIMGGIGNYLVLKTFDTLPNSNFSSTEMSVFLYSLDNGETKNVLHWESNEKFCFVATPFIFQYVFDTKELSVLNLSTGSEQIISDCVEIPNTADLSIVKILKDYVIMQGIPESSDLYSRWAVEIETGKCYSLNLIYTLNFRQTGVHEYFYNVLAELEDYYLVEVDGEKVNYIDTLSDGSKLEAEGFDIVFALMPKQDYVNNITKNMNIIENVDSQYIT